MDFLLQKENGKLATDVNVAREIVEAENEWNINSPLYEEHTVICKSLSELKEEPELALCRIPVGTIEFCNLAAHIAGAGDIPAINVPPELRKGYAPLARRAWDAQTANQLVEIFQTHKRLFVKPADTAKRFETQRIRTDKELMTLIDQQAPPYFVSTEIPESDISAEWRVFFWRDRIMGAQPYMMRDWVAPQRAICMSFLETWKENAPPAGTMDVAVLHDDRTVLIEAHPLISCGLYGFESRNLLVMLRDAWMWHISTR